MFRPLSTCPNEDSLIIEVWDFDPAESLTEKMKKINEVKGVKGLQKWVKGVGATGKDKQDLIGTTCVPMKVGIENFP